QPRSRVKVVVADDTLISIGESSRVSLLDYRSGERSRRSITANVDRGTIRALIGHAFSGNAGRFEIRTPTAVVVSRGSPLAIWIEEIADGIVDPLSGLAVPASVSTGIANLGEAGSVTVSACGQSHGLGPGQYVIAGIDCRTLVPAAVAAAPSVQPLLSASEFRQAPRLGTASQALQSMGAAATIIPQPSAPATGRASRTDASVAGTTSGTAPVVPVTPPAVISGAAGLTPNGTTATAATAQGSATATPTTAPPPAPAPAPPH